MNLHWFQIHLVHLILLNVVISQNTCGPTGSFSIAGSSTVFPIAQEWASGYMAKCPNVAVSVEGGGSSVGAGRVCGLVTRGTPVDIGNMSRQWRASEVTNNGDNTYTCKIGDTSRTAIQVDVAIDGLSVVVVSSGAGNRCLLNLPNGGLSMHQLRWIYSSYTVAQLNATGWNSSALLNSDNNDTTHLWSELDPRCDPAEIRIAGPGDLSGTFDFFRETVLSDFANGETFDVNRPYGYFNSEDDDVLVNYVETSSFDTYGDAIVFFGFAYFSGEGARLYGIPIQNLVGEYVAPTVQSVEQGNYTPLSRRIFMNFLNEPDSLNSTGPFLSFGMNTEGILRVEVTGYVPVPADERAELLARLGRLPPGEESPTPSPNSPSPDCGLFGLGLFCPLSFCGFFGRLFGLCNSV